MYPRNAASPERISIGAVVQASDGAVQTSGVAVKVLPHGGTEASGGGTISYTADGVVCYVPTQAETNYTSFVLVASKSGCFPVEKTVVTTASDVAGYAGADWSKINAPTTTLALTNTTFSTTQQVASVSGAVNSVTTGVTLANDAISSSKIADGALTAAKFASGAFDAVWTVSVRTLSSFGTLISDIWSSATRTLSAFAFTPTVGGLDSTAQSNVRSAIGMTSANLDLQLGAIDDYLDTEMAAALAILAKVNSMLEVSGSNYKFTIDAVSNAPGGGSGSGDWTSTEKEQIRYRLGLDGTESAPVSNTPSLGTVNAHVISVATGITLPATNADDLTELNIYAGVDNTITISDAGLTSDWAKIYFTVKSHVAMEDSSAIIQVVVTNPSSGTDGLLYLAASSATASQASITANVGADTITVFLSAAATTQLTKNVDNGRYDVKIIFNDDTVPLGSSNGVANVIRRVTRAVS